MAGTWILDAERSEGALFASPTAQATDAVIPRRTAPAVRTPAVRETLTLSVTGDQLAVTRHGVAERLTTPLDGGARTLTYRGAAVRTRAWRDGAALVLVTARTVTLPGGSGREVHTTERFSGGEDGTLQHEQTVEQAGERRTRRLVYQVAQ